MSNFKSLEDLLKVGFTNYSLSVLNKKDDKGNVLEVYRLEPCKEYFLPMNLVDFEVYKTEAARKLKKHLDKMRSQAGTA